MKIRTKLAPAIASFLVVIVTFSPIHAAGDTSPNAMIHGGCFSRAECAAALTNGDGVRSGAQLTRTFKFYDVTPGRILSDNTVNGVVTKGGHVIVRGETIATGAYSYGHSQIPGSVKVSSGLWKRPTSVSFQSSELPALVHLRNNKFAFAIIKDCGNVVTATPVATPPAPTTTVKHRPQPTPTPTPAPDPAPVSQVQVQAQTQTVVVNPVATPAPTPAHAPPPTPAPAPAPAPVAAALPQTGTALNGLAGASAILLAAWYYRRSQRSLLNRQLDT